MSRFLHPDLQKTTPYTPGIHPPSSADTIKLNTNENPYPPSPMVQKAITSDEIDALAKYPDPSCTELIATIAAYHGVGSENICIGNGSDELLAFCFWGLAPQGTAFPDLTYGFYNIFSQAYNRPAHIVPVREDFSIAIEDYASVTQTIFLANPNAPTGLYLALSQIEALLQQRPDRLIIVDEAYIDFAGESAVSLINTYDNLLVIRTMSKSRSLAGARLGYALGCKDIISDLQRIRFCFNPYSINRLSLLAGTAAIKDEAYFNACREKIIETREYTIQAFRAMGFHVTDCKTNFILCGAHPEISATLYDEKLREQNIFVRYFPVDRILDYVRISIGTQKEMEQVVAVTQKILREMQA